MSSGNSGVVRRRATILKGYQEHRQRLLCSLLLLLLVLLTLSGCAAGAGIFSGSGSWQTSNLPDQNIRTVVVDPNNQQKLYAGDMRGAVFVSSDSAAHWTKHIEGLPQSNTLFQLAFDGAGKHLYAATAQGLFVSADAAGHWHAIGVSSLPHDSITALAFDLRISVSTSAVLFLGTAHHGVFRSSDAGESWSPISTGLSPEAAINSLIYDTDARQLWAATSVGVYRTDNQETAWTDLSSGLPDGVAVNVVEPASVAGGTRGLIYAGTAQGFYRSQDGAQHWKATEEAFATYSIHAILIDFRSSNNSTIYMGSAAGALQSTDNGQSWNNIATGMPKGSKVYALAIGGSGNAQLLAAANTLYLYPGNSRGGLGVPQFLAVVIMFGAFFYLSRLPGSMRRRQRARLAQQAPKPPTPPLDGHST